MTVQFSDAVRNAVANAVEATAGTAPVLQLITGDKPSSCSAADTGTVLVEMTLPEDYYTDAEAGVKSLQGTWSAAATGAGTIGHYRIYDNAKAQCHEQGTVTVTGGGGDLQLDSVGVVALQIVTIASKTLTASGA